MSSTEVRTNDTASSPLIIYERAMAEAEIHFQAHHHDACIHACCQALNAMPGEEAPAHLISACHSAMRADSGVAIQPAPVFFTNWELFKKQRNSEIFPGSVCPAAGNFLYALVRLLAPSLVIETGTLYGFSCLCIAQALKDNGHGKMLAFDLFKDENYHNVPDGETGIDQVRRFIDDALLSEVVTLCQGNSPDEIRSWFDANPEKKVSMAFIDGDHFMKGCVEDFLAVDERLAEGGFIVLHDTEPRDSGWMGPRFLIERLKQADREQGYEILNLPTVDRLGMCLLKKNAGTTVPSWRPSLKELLAEVMLFNMHFRRR